MFGARVGSVEAWAERLFALLVIAVLLAASDQWLKVALETPTWAVHRRSLGWFAGSCLLFACLAIAALIPSRATTVAAGVFAGGVLGNLMSAATDLTVPNPLIVMRSTGGIAFNAADAFIFTGNIALTAALTAVCVRHRVVIDNRLRRYRRG